MSSKKKRPSGAAKQFAMVPLDVLEHPAVATLHHGAFRIMVLLAGQYRGHNNGALGLTEDQAKKGGIGSDNTLYKSLEVLAERGIIEQTYPSSRVPPRPAMFALSWKPIDETKWSTETRTPSFSFRSWASKVSK